MEKITFRALACMGVLLAGCVEPAKNKPDPTRQPWRDSWQALPAAKAGSPEGLRKSFAAARAQVMLPYVNAGEDAEAIMTNMIAIIESVGDKRFAEALLREHPETRSAVREFLFEEKTRTRYPRSHGILADAPMVMWPSDVAEERLYIEYGDVVPPKKQWTR
ncbi:MAG: hypothetical protein V4733_06650 [Verrucomicrobiota bacterium]